MTIKFIELFKVNFLLTLTFEFNMLFKKNFRTETEFKVVASQKIRLIAKFINLLKKKLSYFIKLFL